MATSSKSTSGSKSGGAAKSASASRANPAQDIQDAVMKAGKGMAERLQALNVSGAAGTLLESRRKDLEALAQANAKSYKGLQAVVQRQTEMMRSAIGDWQSEMKGMQGGDMSGNLAKLDQMGRASFQRALDDIKELAQLAAQSQADAFEVVRDRINENVAQVSEMLQKPGK